VLHALHDAGHELVQLAVNLDLHTMPDIPWPVVPPTFRTEDPYGLRDLVDLVKRHQPFDALWTTFDPEVPWRYDVPGMKCDALSYLLQLRQSNPGFRMLGWFPVDGGPLRDMEMAVLGLGSQTVFDVPATMSPHVHDLIAWTLELRGMQEGGLVKGKANLEAIQERLRVIPHGVDLKRYKVSTREERADAKERMGMDSKVQVILQLERNQARKQNYLGLDLLARLFSRWPDLRGKVMLYQHMQQDEESQGCGIGFNLPELAKNYGLRLGTDIMWPPGWVSEEDMSRTVYACADAFLSTSTGEGFQYPAWEALACGVPLVVPNDSAREAWFGRLRAPNVHLYAVSPRDRVLPGGYNRRMSSPLMAEAAPIMRKVLKRGHDPKLAARGREWVQQYADVRDVRRQWVDLVAEQEQELVKQRKGMQVVVQGDVPEGSLQVDMQHGPGLGDLVMAGPALRALKRQEPGRTIRLGIPRSHLEMAKLYQLADEYDVQDIGEANRYVAIHDLYHPKHQGDWGNPRVHRSEVIAQHLGVDITELEPFAVTLDTELLAQVRARFMEAFGIDPAGCVVIALESANPHRALPVQYIHHLAAQVQRMGATPVVTGRNALGIRTHGVVDLTGQTDMPYLASLLALVGAVVTTDSATLHLAGAVGTPTVGCFTLFAPEARLGYYEAPWVAVVPPHGTKVAGEEFPTGPKPKAQPGEWAAQLKPDTIAQALAKLMNVEPEEPRLVVPE
jgi:ADP-heptose:LPS heptosyltransferase/glycosyltransferase involved in cell wall biosynthesis